MNYREYYLIRERKFFTDLNQLVNLVLDDLREQIEKKGGVKPGQTFKVSIGDEHKMDIKFYKGYSRAALDHINSNNLEKKVGGMYFPKTAENNPRIEVYINSSKKQNSYYKQRTFEDFINKSLPKYIKDIITHELTHAYEDLVKNVLQYKPDTKPFSKEYYNSSEEMNAYLNDFINSVLSGEETISSNVMFYLKQNKIKEACREVFSVIASEDWIKNLTRENKIKIIKNIYTTLSGYAENLNVDKAGRGGSMRNENRSSSTQEN